VKKRTFCGTGAGWEEGTRLARPYLHINDREGAAEKKGREKGVGTDRDSRQQKKKTPDDLQLREKKGWPAPGRFPRAPQVQKGERKSRTQNIIGVAGGEIELLRKKKKKNDGLSHTMPLKGDLQEEKVLLLSTEKEEGKNDRYPCGREKKEKCLLRGDKQGKRIGFSIMRGEKGKGFE